MGDKITDIEKLFSINHIKEGQKLLLVDCPKEIFSYCKKFQPAKLVGCYIDSAECKEMADEYEVITAFRYFMWVISMYLCMIL